MLSVVLGQCSLCSVLQICWVIHDFEWWRYLTHVASYIAYLASTNDRLSLCFFRQTPSAVLLSSALLSSFSRILVWTGLLYRWYRRVHRICLTPILLILLFFLLCPDSVIGAAQSQLVRFLFYSSSELTDLKLSLSTVLCGIGQMFSRQANFARTDSIKHESMDF
jgi:hypothetical protein